MPGETHDPFAKGLRALPAHTRHLIDGLERPHRTRIMDVGANPANVPAYAPLIHAGAAEVHGFEPGADAFAKLAATAKSNEFYHPFAIGLDEDATFFATKNGSFASLFRPDEAQIETLGHWAESLTVAEEIPVQTQALDALPGLPRPDMLKMDTQGAELSILQGGADVLSDAVVIMPELRFFRLYEDEPMMGALDSHLRDMGFMLHKILPGAVVRLTSSRIAKLRPAMTRNQMVDADFIYIRDLAQTDALSTAQIGHLALLADTVFQSMDVVLRCLDLLLDREALQEQDIDGYIDALPPNFRAR